MKNNLKILMLLALMSFKSYGQDSLAVKKDSLKTKVFCFTPKFKEVGKVNGLTIGAGINFLPNEESSIVKVNGINIEINPISPLIFMFADPRDFVEEPEFVLNGINISTGNQNNATINGLNFSGILNIGYACNGISTALAYNYSTNLNGIHISGFANISKNSNGITISFISNDSEKMNGLQVSFFNNADFFNGIQIGVSNHSTSFAGLQIGLWNKTDKNKGLQIGFWNINNKRSMPFINW